MTRTINTTELALVGAEELKKLLQKLPEKTAIKIQRKAMKTATESLLGEARARVPVKSGALAASIKAKIRKLRGGVQGQVIAGDETAWYAHLVEYGFWHTSHSGKITSAGYIPGKKFLRSAIETQAQNIVDTFTQSVAEAIEDRD